MIFVLFYTREYYYEELYIYIYIYVYIYIYICIYIYIYNVTIFKLIYVYGG